MNLFQKQQKTSGYNSIPDAIADDETAAVSRRSSKTRIALVAGTMMMLVAGGAVWMQDESSSYTTTAEGLVIATEADPMLAAGGAVWMQDESSYTTTAEGLVVATEATPDYFRICRGADEVCCSSDHGTNKPCCGQAGGDVAPQWQCPESRPFCKEYIYGNRYGHCTPRPVPSDSDKRQYGVKLCGDYRDSNGHEVSLPETILKGGNYHPRGFEKYNSQRTFFVVFFDENYLWGGSCGGTCGGSSAHPTCTF